MRIRSIRPEFWSSEDIASLSWEHRLIYIGLWSYVDDNGVGRDNAKLIAADLFPLEDDPPVMSIHGALSEYSRREMITRYTVDGKAYLHVKNFHVHQRINRPSEGRYPAPTSGNAVIQGALTEPSLSPHANGSLGEGEKGRRGEGEHTSSTPVEDDRFDEFWDVYPRKVSKKNAKAKWDTLMKRRVDPDRVISGAKVYARAVAGSQPEHIKHPDGWLNGERWEDDVKPISQIGRRLEPAPAYYTPPAADPENLPWLKDRK